MNRPIIGRRVAQLLQTPFRNIGPLVGEFGDAFSCELVLQLDDGEFVRLGEYDCGRFDEPVDDLAPAELTLGRLPGRVRDRPRRPPGSGAWLYPNESSRSASPNTSSSPERSTFLRHNRTKGVAL